MLALEVGKLQKAVRIQELGQELRLEVPYPWGAVYVTFNRGIPL